MKTIEKTQYYKPQLDAMVKEMLSDFDHQTAIDAENYGIRNKPPLLERNLKPYFSENHHKAQAIISLVGADLQPAILVSEMIESEKITDRKVQALHNKLVVAKEKSRESAKHLKGKQREYSKLRIPLMWIAICLPLLGDGILNQPTFEAYGYNFIEAFCMSILLAASLAALAHSFDRIVALGKSLWQRKFIVGSIFFLLTALFYYMAATRATYLSNEATTNGASIHFSPLPFALISTLLFVIAVAINHFFFPNRELRKAMREYDVLEKKHQDNCAEQQQIEQEIEGLNQTHEELRQTNGSIYVYGGHIEDMIIARANAGFANWKKVNMMHRPDNGRPIGFESDEYPFAFQRNFKPVNRF